VLTLALGIGANTAIFNLVNAVLLRPMAVQKPEEIVSISAKTGPTGPPESSSYLDYLEFRDGSRDVLTGVAAVSGIPSAVYLSGATPSRRVWSCTVSGNYFTLLGVQATQGRTFLEEDDTPGAAPVVMLSERVWRQQFGADVRVIGTTVRLNELTCTVVGIVPDRAAVVQRALQVDVFLPAASFAQLKGGKSQLDDRRHRAFEMIGRLRAGVSVGQAQARFDVLAAQLQRQYPQEWTAERDGRVLARQIRVVPEAQSRIPPLFGSAGIPGYLTLLAGFVGMVLLIACANLANLLLVRAAARRREIAIRAALGASRGRILRQLLTESVLLAALGGAAGLLLAFWATGALNSLGQEVLPRMRDVGVDGHVLAFTLLVSLFTGVLFGLLPALHGSSIDLRESLSETSTGAAGGRRRLTSALIVGEVALALMLLTGAGLLMKSMYRLLRVDAGFDAQGVLTAELSLPAQKYIDPQLLRAFSPAAVARAAVFYDEVIAGVRAVPGVNAVGAVSSLPLAGDTWGKHVVLHDRPLPASADDLPEIQYRLVAGDYFRALGIRVRGRAFTDADGLRAAPVAIVNRELARRYFKGQDPIGKEISVNPPRELVPLDTVPPDYRPQRATVVGIADDVRYGALDRAPGPLVYVPYAQGAEGYLSMFLTVRAESDPLALIGAVREQVRRTDPDQAIGTVSTFEARVSRALAQPRLQTGLLGLFAAMAVLLAAIGIYGVMAVAVVQRTKEIGIRMALGAVRRDVLVLVVRQGFALAAGGLVIGVAGALALTRVLQSLLFAVSATDPTVFGGIVGLLALVALVACYLPARSAARVDPMVALRHE